MVPHLLHCKYVILIQICHFPDKCRYFVVNVFLFDNKLHNPQNSQSCKMDFPMINTYSNFTF